MKNILGVIDKVHGCDTKIKYELSFYNKKYNKRLTRFAFVRAHSTIDLKIGDSVLIRSCRPISKTKKYIVVSKKEDL